MHRTPRWPRIATATAVVWLATGSWAGAAPLEARELECRECHAVEGLTKVDTVTGEEMQLTIDLKAYAASDHGEVTCYTCHDRGYEKLPHTGPLRYPRFLCVDCHGDEQGFAELRMAQRKQDLLASAHGKQAEHRFDCSDCHDPHRFRLVREQGRALDRIEASNEVCLQCHGGDNTRLPAFAELKDVRRLK